MPSGSCARPPRGFSYLLLLVVIATLTVTAGAVSVGRNAGRRNAEQALLVAGEELRVAIASYRSIGGSAGASGPKELADLLRDPRVPGVRRHLRRIPVDPLTGRATWGVIRDAAGDIVAMHSLAEGKPLKRDGFEVTQAGFENADSYANWRFGIGVIPSQTSK